MPNITSWPNLCTEIATDPNGNGYAGKTPQEIAALINADVSTVNVNAGIISKDLFFLIRAMPALSVLWAMSPTNATYIAFLPWLSFLSECTSVDASNATIQATINAAVEASLLTSEQASAVLNTPVLRTINLFGGPVDVDDILTALRQV
jgi:hypothetical protein